MELTTQPEGAVGGDEPIVAAEPTIEDRLAAAMEPPEEEAAEPAEVAEPQEEPELSVEDVEAEPEETPEEQPPITPPASLTAEEKEAFAKWPRDAQESFQRRVTDLEKGFHTKAQEAKSAKDEAVQRVLEIQDQFAQQVQALLPPIPDKPSHLLQADDPWEYARQIETYENALAQHQWAQQALGQIGQQTQAAREAALQQEQQESVAILQDKFPEYLDATKGPEVKAALRSTALELGYSDEQLAQVDATDIMAMKQANDWRTKAQKYDALMAKKMEKVRDAKNLPRVSKPGVPQGQGAIANQKYTADREAMRQGDPDATARVFSRFIQ